MFKDKAIKLYPILSNQLRLIKSIIWSDHHCYTYLDQIPSPALLTAPSAFPLTKEMRFFLSYCRLIERCRCYLKANQGVKPFSFSRHVQWPKSLRFQCNLHSPVPIIYILCVSSFFYNPSRIAFTPLSHCSKTRVNKSRNTAWYKKNQPSNTLQAIPLWNASWDRALW